MKFIIHRGANEIGGTCLEVASDTTRIILDCGWPLEDDGPVTPPPVPGLFVPGTPPQALLLTHGHPDHIGFISDITSNLPIYATVPTSKMMLAGSIYAGGIELPQERFQALPFPKAKEDCTSVKIGDLLVTPFPVDHSACGAVAFLVEHCGKRIFYTGDLRFHGRKPGMHQRIVRELREKLDLLVIEGTNLGRESTGLATESAVEDFAVKTARDQKSLVMVAFSPQNLDRFVSFFRAAMRTGRTFVCDHYMAAVLYLLHLPALPKPSAKGQLRVYFPTDRKRVEKLEQESRAAAIALDEIIESPQQFMMLVRPGIIDAFNRDLPDGTQLLFGMWSGYREKREWVQAQTLIAKANGGFMDCHASGHASPEGLFKFIEELAPKRIAPVHTLAPQCFASRFPKIEIIRERMLEL
jgi:ribonuclease J